MDNYIRKQIHENIELNSRILQDLNLIKNIQDISKCIIKAFRENKKILICGNGGSAADAQHMAAELVGRFSLERKGLPAIALTTDTSTITAITNDYSYEVVFARQIEALVQEGDIVIGISTSGNSKNITNAFKKAKEKNAQIIGLLGKSGGENLIYSDIAIVIPSSSTPRIQEIHIMIIHILCDLVERTLFNNEFTEKILMEGSLL